MLRMKSSIIYRKRLNFFEQIVSNFKHERLSDLVVAHKLDKKLFKKLQLDAVNYSNASSKYSFTNRTPNGRLAPKKEIEKQFNNFSKSYFQMLEYLNIVKSLKNFLVPVIRFKENKINTLNQKNRSRSELPHADCWAGWTEDYLLFLLPLYGDIKNNKVNFFEVPKNISKDWFKKMDFITANKKIKQKLKPIKEHYKLGYVYVVDISVPHVTKRNKKSKSRISIDSALQFKAQNLKSSKKSLTAYISSKENFIPIRKAKLLKKKYILSCNYIMGEFEKTSGKNSKPVYSLKKLN